MGFVNTELDGTRINEVNPQDGIAELLGANGWGDGTDGAVLRFYKVIYDRKLADERPGAKISPLYDLASGQNPKNETFARVARHIIFKNAEGRMFGFAVLTEKVTFTFEELFLRAGGEQSVLDAMNATLPPSNDPGFNAALQARNAAIDAFNAKLHATETLTQLVDAEKNGTFFTNTTWYLYQLEKLPDIDGAGAVTLSEPLEGFEKFTKVILLPWGNSTETELERMAADIEVLKADIDATGKLRIMFDSRDAMQSPISKATIRTKHYEDLYDDTLDYAVQRTNWWSDSEIRVIGTIDENSVFFIIQADNVPAWEGAAVPVVPLYFGKIEPINPTDDKAYAFFTGSVAANDTSLDDIARFDMDNPSRSNFAPMIMPLLKSYPSKPSNGIDTVMISRSRYGSRYQEYFLSWNTAPNLMPPTRSDNGHDYPRAWNNMFTDVYKYQFNPSRYSGKVHSSKIYVVHPEEGVRGTLSLSIGLNATNFHAGKLRVRREACSDVYDIYRYFVVDGVSPLTKRPGTAFRPIGLGLLDPTATS